MGTRNALVALATGAALAMPALADGLDAPARLVEEIGVTRQGDDVAVTVLFGCTVRYLSHFPADTGEAVHVRLVPGEDCGSPASGWVVPPPLDDRGVIRGVTADRNLGRDVDFTIRWATTEQYVVVPAYNGRGLRIQLVRAGVDHSHVTVMPMTPSVAYAVNLDASRTPFDPTALAAAKQATKVPVYVSQVTVDGDTWYRLRAGPFLAETDARQVLATARGRYPKAWLAVADDGATVAPDLSTTVMKAPEVPTTGNTTLTPADIDRDLAAARTALRKKDYPQAIQLLTTLTAQPEFPQRAEAQEMLGLARERNGQLAHAKAEYEDYLRRYPNGEAAGRVRTRLSAITFAASPASRQARASGDAGQWKVFGGFSQTYLRDMSSFDNGAVSTKGTTQNALLNDASIAVRRSGERYDFAARAAGAYGYDMLSDGPGNQGTVSVFYAELHDRVLDWSVRGGRQSGTLGGLIGTFDGFSGGYRVAEHLRLSAYAGYPVDTARDAPSSDRTFYALSADFGTFAEAWDLSLYAINQTYLGDTDRQAVGTEVRYFRPGLTFVGLADYDLHFAGLNDAMVLATAALPDRWTISLNYDHRRSPGLSLRNAMIGQPVSSFDQLFDRFTLAEIEQLALDRSATADTCTVSVSRPFGERWQWSADFSSASFGATPASGGVEAMPASGTDLIGSTQLMGYGLLGRGDVSSLGFQYQTGDTSDTISVGTYLQLPVGEHWRVMPRLRYDQRSFHTDGSTQSVFSPALRAEMRWSRVWLEFEGGAEIGQRDFGNTGTDTSRYYFSLGYRYDL